MTTTHEKKPDTKAGKPAKTQAEEWGDRSGTSRDEMLDLHTGPAPSNRSPDRPEVNAVSGRLADAAVIVCAGSPGTVVEGDGRPDATPAASILDSHLGPDGARSPFDPYKQLRGCSDWPDALSTKPLLLCSASAFRAASILEGERDSISTGLGPVAATRVSRTGDAQAPNPSCQLCMRAPLIEKGERCPSFTGRCITGLRTPVSTLTGVAAALIEKVDSPRKNRPARIVEFIDDITGKAVGYDELRRVMGDVE